MSEWKTYKWGDLISLEYGKPIPDKNLLDGQYPVYGTNGRIGTSNLTPLCKHPSIIVGRKGAYRGVHYSNKPFSVIDTAFFIEPKTSILDLKWAYYKLLTVDINKMDSGSAIPSTDRYEIYSLSVELPPLEEQQRIAGILGSLDDKIELNRRINANLEAQAQALFRSWFVDFEPFRDGPFVDSQLGKIPQGWKVVELGDVTKQQTEKVGPQKTVKVLSPITTGELVLSEEYFTKQVFSESIAKYIIVKPNQFAYNPARINIGSIGRNTFEFDGCVSPVYVVFECEKGYHYFFDFFRKTDAFKQEVISRAIGGVRQTLGYKDFALIKVIYPPRNVVQEFNALYINLLNLQNHNDLEIKTLSALRDTLLPKLMAGEIAIE